MSSELQMSSNHSHDKFVERSLDELLTRKNQGVNTTTEKVSYSDAGIPVIRANNVLNGVIDYKDIVYVNKETFARIKEPCKPRNGDILYTNIGSQFGNAAKVEADFEFAIAWNVMRLQPRDDIDSDFLMYLLNNPETKSYIRSLNSSSTMPFVSGKEIGKVQLKVPAIDTQRSISFILRAFDDRIALLRETNTTLEAIAQALFKSWFVDFDPVHANAGTQTPSLPAEIQALFPSRLVESPQGLIPEGWDSAALGDFLDVLATGRRPKGGVASFSEGIPSIGAESIKGIGNFDFAKTKYVPIEFFEKMKSGLIEDYDVLLYKDGGKPGEFKPRVSMFGNSFPFETFSINEHVFRMRSDYLGQAFLYFYVSHERTLNELSNRGGKAAIPGINQTDVKTLKLIVPSKCVLEEFQSRIEPLLCNILANASRSHNLAKLRDTLLPRLISGQLRLPEAEAALAEVY